jgi:hypothetical protein
MESSFDPSLAMFAVAFLQSLEENFTLAVIVFIIGFIATLVTLIYIVSAHRYWERRDARESSDASREESQP